MSEPVCEGAQQKQILPSSCSGFVCGWKAAPQQTLLDKVPGGQVDISHFPKVNKPGVCTEEEEVWLDPQTGWKKNP